MVSFTRIIVTTTTLALSVCAYGTAAFANPTGGTVTAGEASISSAGRVLTVKQGSDRAVIDWRTFDIGSAETTQFFQPSDSSITVNRVNSKTYSQISGRIQANGNVVIINPNGIVFGHKAQVDVNGLVATTADIDTKQFMNEKELNFTKAGNPNATISNDGRITAKDAGLVGLVAPNVINTGTISAKLGRVMLGTGDTATVDMYGDGLMKVAVSDKVTSMSLLNLGTLRAKGGTVQMTAATGRSLVNNLILAGGELRAPTIEKREGKIVISAADNGAVIKVTGRLKAASIEISPSKEEGKKEVTRLSTGKKIEAQAMDEKQAVEQKLAIANQSSQAVLSLLR